MAFIGKTTLKKWLIERIKPIIKSYEYKVVTRFGTTVIQKENDDFLYYFYISTNKWDYIGYSPFGNICIKKVGNIFLEIIKNKDLGDGSLGIKVIPNFEYGPYGKEVSSQDEINDIVESFKRVFLEYYLPAFERYSDPKNVLEFWDSLNDEGKLKHFFDSYNRVKIIILSKMCNDESYERRCQEAIDFYTMHYNNGIESAKGLIDDCYKVIKYLEENEV